MTKKQTKAETRAIELYKSGETAINAYHSAFPLSKKWKTSTIESKAQRLFDSVNAIQPKKPKRVSHVKSSDSIPTNKQTKSTQAQETLKIELSDEQKYLLSKCTQLQQRIVINITQGNMSNRQAYYDAGGQAKNDNTADSSVGEILLNPAVSALYDSLTQEKLNDAIMIRDEGLEILTSISRSRIDDEEQFKLKVQSKLAAIKQLALMQGWDAASKHEHTGKDGEAIKMITSEMTAEEASQIYQDSLKSK